MINLTLSCHIGWRYARSRKGGTFLSFISFFTVIGVALGVAALITVMSVMDGFEQELKSRILGSVPHVVVKGENIDPQLIDQLISAEKSRPLIAQVSSLVQANTIIQVPGELFAVQTQGVLNKNDVPLGIKGSLTQGSWQKLVETRYGIVLGRYLATEYGLSVGSKVRLLFSGASHYTPVGRIPAQRNFTVVGVFETASESEKQSVFVNAASLNRLLKKPENSSEGVKVTLHDAFDAQTVSKNINTVLSKNNIDASVEYWQKTHGTLFKAVQMEKNMMAIMLLLIIMVAAFNIVSALVMMVTKKQGEIAILKTQGMRPTDLAAVFVFQGGYNGLLGAVIGSIGGMVICLGLNPFTELTGIQLLGPVGLGLPLLFSWQKLFFVFSMAVLLAFLASIYPAIKAASLKPSHVLRYE